MTDNITELNDIMQKLLEQREEAMKILEPGRMFTIVGNGEGKFEQEEIPTTIVERAKWTVVALAAESDEVDRRGKRIKKLSGLLRKVCAVVDNDLRKEIENTLDEK